ncbi:phosphatidylinositol-specific phospholipase C domain-containing protein [Microbulbifer variabilis]|uniref:phosphatidylinositol-specific phospholipase C domain-containing protein n=1 Tax=Microbulbifer variabilis TaxID=266805 RepID=UPI001CFE485B|nr:phosphatidylinositol-specific phospholipase C domain-containing protein [Microbulbifer variabilis]
MIRSIKQLIHAAFFILFFVSTPLLADSVTDFQNSWTGRALDLQRKIDNHTPMSENNILGTHNSYNSEVYRACNFSVGCRYLDPQQEYSIKDQLRLGARFIELDVHWTAKMESLFSYPKRLLLCHGFCSLNDKYATEGFNEVKDWLNDSANQDEVIILYIEDHSDGHHQDLYDQLTSRFGDKIYYSGGCQSIPTTLTKNQVLAAGKQVVLWKDGGCSGNTSMQNMAFTGLGEIGRVWEDSTTIGTIGEIFSGGIERITANDVRNGFALGHNIINLDNMNTSDGRIAAAIWSWDQNEPNNLNNEDCAMQWGNGRWNDSNCSNQYSFACKNITDGSWAATASIGPWAYGSANCQALGSQYAFEVPTNSKDNQALKAAKEATGYDKVWINYQDQSTEGQWLRSE